MCVCVCMCVCTQSCLTLATPWAVACQVLLSVEFSRQEYWSALPFLSPGDLSNARLKPASPALAGRFFTTSASWEEVGNQSFLCYSKYSMNILSFNPHTNPVKYRVLVPLQIILFFCI